MVRKQTNYCKENSRYIRKNYPSSKIKCFQGKGHCEASILNPSVMTAELDTILGTKKVIIYLLIILKLK